MLNQEATPGGAFRGRLRIAEIL